MQNSAAVKLVYSIGGIQLVMAIVLWIFAVMNPFKYQEAWTIIFGVDIMLTAVVVFFVMRPYMEAK